jgi:hypothetical protein
MFKNGTYRELKHTNLASTEIACEIDTNRLKIGTGEKTDTSVDTTPYLELSYASHSEYAEGDIVENTSVTNSIAVENFCWYDDYEFRFVVDIDNKNLPSGKGGNDVSTYVTEVPHRSYPIVNGVPFTKLALKTTLQDDQIYG